MIYDVLNYLKYTNINPAQLVSFFVVLYETRYCQHNNFWHDRPSIIDTFTEELIQYYQHANVFTVNLHNNFCKICIYFN